MRDLSVLLQARVLGLRPADLAEIAGFSERYARDAFRARAPLHADVAEAIADLVDDADVFTDLLVDLVRAGELDALPIYLTNAEARASMPWLPGRGQAAGAFACVANYGCWGALEVLMLEKRQVPVTHHAPSGSGRYLEINRGIDGVSKKYF